MENVSEEIQERLVPLNPGHATDIYKYLNHEKISETYPVSLPYSLEDAQSYVEREISCRKRGTRFSFAIMVKNQFVGICALYDMSQSMRKAKIYYWIAVEYWNKGIASKALEKLIRFAKIELHIAQLKTGVLERNAASRRVLEKNGFFVESILINEDAYHEKFMGEKVMEMKMFL